MGKRDIVLDGVHYRADREALVRDGGSGQWYAVVVDAQRGRCIDRRVPEGTFRTMRECVAAIRAHHHK
jgi:hypothetical protein